jgi:hypothetical protein
VKDYKPASASNAENRKRGASSSKLGSFANDDMQGILFEQTFTVEMDKLSQSEHSSKSADEFSPKIMVLASERHDSA